MFNIVCSPKKDNSDTVMQNAPAQIEFKREIKLAEVTSVKEIASDENIADAENDGQRFKMIDSTPDNPRNIDKKFLMKMIHRFFESDRSCLFCANKENGSISINDILYYEYAAGPNRLLTGYPVECEEGFENVITWAMKTGDSSKYESGDMAALLKEFSGVKPYSIEKEFCYIRPEIIQWAVRNLIPEPGSTVFGVTCQKIYTTMFSGFFRLLYQSLIWLECVDNRFENEYNAYWEKCNSDSDNESYHGSTYLMETYQNLHFEYVAQYVDFSEPEAIGFWLRRYWDGSYLSVKKALFEILQKFDPSIHNDIVLKRRIARIQKEVGGVEGSGKSLFLSTPDMTIEFPQFIYNCEYNTAPWDSLDTVWLDLSAFESCGTDNFDTIQVFKNKKIGDLRITHYGSRTFHFNEHGKGGVWTESVLSNSHSEEVELSSVDVNGTIFIRKNIFSAPDVKWESFSKRDSAVVDSILSEAHDLSCQVLPFSETIKITWRHFNTGKVIRKYVVLQHGYGD